MVTANLIQSSPLRLSFHQKQLPLERTYYFIQFLISEQVALKNHLHARAEHILKEAESL